MISCGNVHVDRFPTSTNFSYILIISAVLRSPLDAKPKLRPISTKIQAVELKNAFFYFILYKKCQEMYPYAPN